MTFRFWCLFSYLVHGVHRQRESQESEPHCPDKAETGGRIGPGKSQHDNQKRWTFFIYTLIYFVNVLLPIVVLGGVGACLQVVRVHEHHKWLGETCHK
jgi:hypothetical protein